MIRISAFLVCCVAVASAASAQQATFRDPLLEHLEGRWVLTGTVAGRSTTHDVSAIWVLAHQYLEFHEVSREKDKSGAPVYQATVYFGWDQPQKEYVCVWLDDFGDISTQSLGHAKRVGESFPFVFQDTADSGKFHTTFAYDSVHDVWTMNMDNETNGKLSPFARTRLTRVQ